MLAMPPWPWRRRAAPTPTTCGVPTMALCLREERNAGEVGRAMGNELPMDDSAVGQTGPLAARLEQLAAPGRVFLTAAAWRLVEGLVQVNARGPMLVKGLSEPVEEMS